MIQLSAKSPTSDIALYIWKWIYSDGSEKSKQAFIVSAKPQDRENASKWTGKQVGRDNDKYGDRSEMIKKQKEKGR